MTFAFSPLKPRSFDLVMIDPAWPWATWSDKGKEKSPDAQYQMQTWDEICALPVSDLLANGGAAVVWCTWPLFGKQHMIVENAWGLRVQTGGAWSKRTVNGKLRWGTGHVMRSVCEPFLIATKGRNAINGRAVKNLIESSEAVEIEGLAREHSRKPDEVYEHFERLTPGWRRADIYSRQRRKGWKSFGNEIDKFAAKR